MSRVSLVTAPAGERAELLGQIQSAFGATPNMFKAVANSPAALKSMWGSFGALGKGVIGARILVDGHQRVGRQPALQHVVDLGLHPAILHRHVQHEWPVQVLHLLDVVLDVGAIVRDRAIDVGAAAHQIAELAAQAITHRADLAVALA